MKWYSEEVKAGNAYREEYWNGIKKFISAERKRADKERKEYFSPDYSSLSAYERSMETYREEFKKMLGYPLSPFPKEVCDFNATETYVASDDQADIYRLQIEVIKGIKMYGILLKKKGVKGKLPLIIAQHGGWGSPEIISSFFDSSNYNDLVRRTLAKGDVAIFAPQLLIYAYQVYGIRHERLATDNKLKQLGSSMAALEVYGLMRCLDYLTTRDDIDADRIGMEGLSYGGFFTFLMAACDKRIKAAYSSCFLNNRFVNDQQDWTWFNAGKKFLDAEIVGLICPKPIYIEVGKKDAVLKFRPVPKVAEQALSYYEKAGCKDKIVYKAHEGTHEVEKNCDDGIEFLLKNLLK